MYRETESYCTENLAFPSVKFSSKAGQQLKKVYTFRYWVIRSLTCYVPYLPHWLTGGKSLLEITFMELAFALFIVTIQGYDGQSSGDLVADIGCLMIIFALRNNVLTFLFGISFERALFWHRHAARLTIILAFIHAYINFKVDSIIEGNKLTGIPMLVLLITASLSYFIKAKSFELFYYFHIISYLTVVILGFIHGATVFSLSVIIWGFDMLVRYYFAVNKVQAEIVSLPGDIVSVKFQKVFDYSPGQYCFISVPQLSYYQFHPFSISSSPHEELVTLHIRALGDWTKKLYELDSKGLENVKNDVEVGNIVEGGVRINQMEERKEDNKQDIMVTLNRSISITVEGPYGLPSIDLGGYYKVYLFIAGGIGITPVQSIHNYLVHKYSIDTSYLKKSFMIWSVKNKKIITNFEKSLNITPAEEFGSEPAGVPHATLISSGNINSHQSIENDIDINSKNNEMQYNPMLQNNQSLNANMDTHNDNGDNDDINHNIIDINSPNPFHYDFYVTGNNGNTDNNIKRNKIDTGKREYNLHNGRPIYKNIFNEISTYCVAMNVSRVAVISCGPSTMVNEAEQLCAYRHKLSTMVNEAEHSGRLTYRHNSIAFDFHKEVFDL